MRYLPDDIEMKEIDRITIEEIKIPSMVLMERAALAVASCVERLEKAASSHILCVCGCGNNGADGLATARILKERGYCVNIWIPVYSKNPSTEWKDQIAITKKLGILEVESPCFEEYTIIVDALFGVGLHRPLEGAYKEAVQKINSSLKKVVAVDIPSGIHAATGKICNVAVYASYTVTFGFEKMGILLYPGAEHVGKIEVADIGFPKSVVDRMDLKGYTYEIGDLMRIPKRAAYSNKGTFGKLLVVAGSKNMCGAAYYAAAAAYRVGAGLVRIFTCEENRVILQQKLPQAVLTTYKEDIPMLEELKKALSWADAIVIGPGLGMSESARKLLKQTVAYGIEHEDFPMVWDADALNLFATEPIRKRLTRCTIITPHLKEMERLTQKKVEDIKGDLIETAVSYARENGGICVLKDVRTVISDGGRSYYVNSTGNSGMATGGSGDVLSGIIGGLLLMKISAKEAAQIGVFLHGLAGERASFKMGEYGMGPDDLLFGITHVLREIEKNQREVEKSQREIEEKS